MRGYTIAAAAGLACSACAGSASDPATDAPSAINACNTSNDALPIAPTQPLPESSPYVTFVDCATGFASDAVFDADREIVHFDASLGAMVSAASSDSVSGWTVSGVELDWSRSGVSFRVRFGTEGGERRAYFTEAGPGTICNLNLAGPDLLYISATSEKPPNP
jgi:hypothetical protein